MTFFTQFTLFTLFTVDPGSILTPAVSLPVVDPVLAVDGVPVPAQGQDAWKTGQEKCEDRDNILEQDSKYGIDQVAILIDSVTRVSGLSRFP